MWKAFAISMRWLVISVLPVILRCGISRRNLSPAENKAITNLVSLIKHAPTEQKRNAIIRAKELVEKGTFASKGFPKSVNDFFNTHIDLMKTPENFINQLFLNVLDKYDLSSNNDNPVSGNNKPRGIINPKIIVNQSFV
jgi:hypothetical protein